MSDVIVDAEALRADVRDKYRGVAAHPGGVFHFHTGRTLAARLGYDPAVVDALPDRAVEAFAGVANPFSLRPLQPGERVVDLGSGVRVRLLRRRRSRGRRGPGGRGWADVVISNGVFNPARTGAPRSARRGGCRVPAGCCTNGEPHARTFDVHGYPFTARTPPPTTR